VNQYAAREWFDSAVASAADLEKSRAVDHQRPERLGNTNQLRVRCGSVCGTPKRRRARSRSARPRPTRRSCPSPTSRSRQRIDRTFTLTPASNQTGTSTVTITVTDAQGQPRPATFNYNVVNPPQASTATRIFHGENDVFRVVRNGSFVDVYRNGVVVLHQDYATSPLLQINGMLGNDTITSTTPAGTRSRRGAGVRRRRRQRHRLDPGQHRRGCVRLRAAARAYGQMLSYTTRGNRPHDQRRADTLSAAGNASISAARMNLDVSVGSLTMSPGSTLADSTDLTVSSGATFSINGTSQTIDALNGAGTVNDNSATSATLDGPARARQLDLQRVVGQRAPAAGPLRLRRTEAAS
jgi:hypothetical protein